jgi:drug/metabolite transporter (DMT)-like permease
MSAARERAGLGFAALCALNGAFVAPVARLTTETGHPVFVAAVTTLFAAATALVVLAALGQLRPLFRGPMAGLLVLLGALGTMVPNALFFAGTARTSALDAVLCLQVEPAYSLALAWGVLGHRLTLRRALSVAVLLGGVGLALSGESSADPLGLAMLLAAPLAWQLSHLVVLRRLPLARPELLTGARYFWGGLWLGAASLLYAAGPGGDEAIWPSSLAAAGLPVLALQGVFLSFCGTMLWYQAISRLDLARATAIVVPSIPLLSLATAFAIVGEVPTPQQGLGLVLVATGVLSFVRAPHAVEARERVPTQTAPLGAPAGDEAGGDAA